MNKKYIIAAMATSFALNMNAQSVKVTGTVVDSNNEPVIGAYIKVKGSSKGAVTDLDIEAEQAQQVATGPAAGMRRLQADLLPLQLAGPVPQHAGSPYCTLRSLSIR